MANKDFHAIVRKYDIPRIVYDTYKAELHGKLVMEDCFGNQFDGEVRVNRFGSVYIQTDTKKILRTYTYRRFAIVRLTYTSKGRFKLFVRDSTRYFDEHSDISGLLWYDSDFLPHPSEFDSVGKYKSLPRGHDKIWDEIKRSARTENQDEGGV